MPGSASRTPHMVMTALTAVLWLCVLPFIPADLAKLVLAVFGARRLPRLIKLPGV